MDVDKNYDYMNNREKRNKKLFIDFLRNMIQYSGNNRYSSRTQVINDILNLLESKSVENFLYFRMLFDLVINDRSISSERLDRRKLLDSAKNGLKKSKKKNYFIEYIERYDLENIIDQFIKFRSLIDNQEKRLHTYDIFLSHKYTNKFYNFTLYFILKYIYGLNVYVDWIEHPNLNRKKLSKNTIDVLSDSLRKSKYLLFFNLDDNTTTTWMAWEVGYFKGLNKQVGILDLGDYLKGRTNVEKLSSNEVFNVNYNKGIYETKSKLDIERFVNYL